MRSVRLPMLLAFVCVLSAFSPAFAEDYSAWAKDHGKASPIWVLPKAAAPSNMFWTVPDMPGSHKSDSFFGPQVCAGCHADIFQQWEGSMMAAAWIDPVFQAVYMKYVRESKDDDEKAEVAMCSRCHTPAGYVSNDLARYTKVLSGVEGEGVFCDFCHSVKSSAGIGNGAYMLEPGNAAEGEPGTKYGPFKDSSSPFHATKFSELHTRSELCGMCHDVNHAHNIMSIENTYSEWRTGPYNTGDPATTVTCQDCHMRQTPKYPSTGSTVRPDVPGFAAPEEMGGKKRPHIWQHYFVGGNLAVTALLGHHPQARMASDRLSHAVTVEFTGTEKPRPGKLYRMPVRVTNSGAGHYLPTGLTFVREMWLDVTVKDSDGSVIFRSGDLDEKGNIKPGAVIYHSILGKGGQAIKPTLFLPEATQVLYDHRIAPLGYDLEEFVFEIPRAAKGPLSYRVEMRYRSAPQSLIDGLLGKDAPKLPVFDMGEAEGTIKF
jgi:Cytochrome c554 and c-prime